MPCSQPTSKANMACAGASVSAGYFQKVGTNWNKKTAGKTVIPLFCASLKCPESQARFQHPLFFTQSPLAFSSHSICIPAVSVKNAYSVWNEYTVLPLFLCTVTYAHFQNKSSVFIKEFAYSLPLSPFPKNRGEKTNKSISTSWELSHSFNFLFYALLEKQV